MAGVDPRQASHQAAITDPYTALLSQVADLRRRVEELERLAPQTGSVRSSVDGRLLRMTYDPATNHLTVTEPDGSTVSVTLT